MILLRILCIEKGSLSTWLKLPIAGARILAFNCGKVRGIIPLKFLKLFQNLMRCDLCLQDFFKQAFSTNLDMEIFE